MEKIFDFLFITLPNLILIGLGLYLAIRMLIGPLVLLSQRGIIVEFSDPLVPGNCDGKLVGSSGLPVRVRLENECVISAEVSPCTVCMEQLKKGDAVSITLAGGRRIAHKASRWRLGRC